ncbi:glycosyltransferase [Phascolarctobacterium succinatutens]
MNKICVIGNFGSSKGRYDGQTVKTHNTYQALCNILGNQNVNFINTNGGLKKMPVLIFKTILAAYQNNNIIMLPAQNGLKLFAPLLSVLARISDCKMHYVVIGGWLPDVLRVNAVLRKSLMNFCGIYVETNTMKIRLEKDGLKNIYIFPNFKHIKVLNESDLVITKKEPLKLCTFSRVMKEKGIDDAVNAVKAVNDVIGRNVYTLDIYGQIDKEQTDWFAKLQTKFPDYVKYKGLVPFDKTTEVLKDYFLLLFPTKFYTEGIPGTIIDAYAAGVPVACSKWQSFADLVDDTVGYGYEFSSEEALENLLTKIYLEDIDKISVMKKACILKSRQYMPEKAIKILINKLQ